MKKVFYLVLILGFVFSLPVFSFATEAFTSSGPGSTLTGVLNNFQTSKKVTIEVTATSTAYAAASGHLNGDKKYGSTSGDSVIHVADKTEGTPIVAGDANSGTISGWSNL